MDLQVLIKVYLQKKKSPRFFKVGHKLVYFDENFKLIALMLECRVKVDQVLLTNACGCYGAVLMRLIPNNLFNSENNFNSNCVPLSTVMVIKGIPKSEIYCETNVLAVLSVEILSLNRYASGQRIKRSTVPIHLNM